MCSAYCKCLWVCWDNSIFRLACCCTIHGITVLVAAHILLHIPKCFDTLPILLAHFIWFPFWWPSYHGSDCTPTSALCIAAGFLSKCVQLQMLFYFLHCEILTLCFLQIFWTFGSSCWKLASIGIVVLCWWPKAIELPVTEQIASAGRHQRQDGLEDLKVSLICRLKVLFCE